MNPGSTFDLVRTVLHCPVHVVYCGYCILLFSVEALSTSFHCCIHVNCSVKILILKCPHTIVPLMVLESCDYGLHIGSVH